MENLIRKYLKYTNNAVYIEIIEFYTTIHSKCHVKYIVHEQSENIKQKSEVISVWDILAYIGDKI